VLTSELKAVYDIGCLAIIACDRYRITEDFWKKVWQKSQNQ